MPRRVFRYAGRDWPDPRNTRAWKVLAAQVVDEEPLCWLRLDGCTTASETADHVVPVSVRPDLGMDRANHRGACRSCNNKRGAKPAAAARMHASRPRPAALSVFD